MEPAESSAINPNTDAGTLYRLASTNPELRPLIASHPNAYDGLLEWLGTLGDPAVDAALKLRAAGESSEVDEVEVDEVPAENAPEVEQSGHEENQPEEFSSPRSDEDEYGPNGAVVAEVAATKLESASEAAIVADAGDDQYQQFAPTEEEPTAVALEEDPAGYVAEVQTEAELASSGIQHESADDYSDTRLVVRPAPEPAEEPTEVVAAAEETVSQPGDSDEVWSEAEFIAATSVTEPMVPPVAATQAMPTPPPPARVPPAPTPMPVPPPAYAPRAGIGPGMPNPVPASQASTKKNSTLTVIMVILVILALVALGVVVVIFMGLGNKNGDDVATPQPTVTVTESAEPSPTESKEPGPSEEPEEELPIVFPAPANAQQGTLVVAPSGNIACALGEDNVRCTIFENNYADRGYQMCPNIQTTLSAGESGTQILCGGADVVSAGGASQLAYNATVTNDRFACTSRETGMTCWDMSTGASFAMARNGWVSGSSGAISEGSLPW